MQHRQQGFFLIEVIVAASVVAVVLVLLVGSIQHTVSVSERALERTQASFLLEEGAEAVKSIRDTSWASIARLSPSATYYLSWNGTGWSLGTTPVSVDGFTRSVTVTPVLRNGSDDIAATGTADVGTRKVTVTVAWAAPSGTQAKTLELYVANIRE